MTSGLSWKHTEQGIAPGLVGGLRCKSGLLELGQESLEPRFTLRKALTETSKPEILL